MEYKDFKNFSLSEVKENLTAGARSSGETTWQMFILTMKRKDGSVKYVKLFAEKSDIDLNSIPDSIRDFFFISRLFGYNGLFKKEHRDDFIYLGKLDLINDIYKVSRHHLIGGVDAQAFFDQNINAIQNVLAIQSTLDDKNDKRAYYSSVVDKIVKNFNQKYGTNFSASLMTIVEDQERNLKLGNTSDINYNNIGAYYNSYQNEIVVLFDPIWQMSNINSDKDHGLTYMVYAVFHELRHRLQCERPETIKSKTSYDENVDELYRFMIKAESSAFELATDNENFYENNHDNMLFEIDADIAGVDDAYDFCQTSLEQNSSAVDFNYYLNLNRYNYYRLLTYDTQCFTNRLIEQIKAYPDIIIRENGYFSDPFIYEFFDNSGYFKEVREIMTNPVIREGNQEIVRIIMSSSHFIDRLDRMTDDEREYVLDFARETLEKYVELQNVELQSKFAALNSLRFVGKFTTIDSNDQKPTYNIDLMADISYYVKLQRAIIKYDYPRVMVK